MSSETAWTFHTVQIKTFLIQFLETFLDIWFYILFHHPPKQWIFSLHWPYFLFINLYLVIYIRPKSLCCYYYYYSKPKISIELLHNLCHGFKSKWYVECFLVLLFLEMCCTLYQAKILTIGCFYTDEFFLSLEYTTRFVPWFYRLNKLTLVEESQSQSGDHSWQSPQIISSCITVTDSDSLASYFDSMQSEDIKHVWYFQPILEHMFSFAVSGKVTFKSIALLLKKVTIYVTWLLFMESNELRYF